MTISITCNSCRAPNAQGAKFCRQCGASLAATTAPPMVVRACPACGQPAVGAQKFCRGCGQPLAAMSQDVQDAAARGAAPTPADHQAAAEDAHTPARLPPSEPPTSATHRMPPRLPEIPARSSPKSNAPKPSRRKIWPWAVAGGLLAAIGVAGGLVYTGKLMLPLVAQRLVQDYVPVQAPEFQVGDTWTYEDSSSDNRHPTVTSSRHTYRVTSIEGDRVTVTPEDSGRDTRFSVYDTQRNLIESHTVFGKQPSFEAYEGIHHKSTYSPPWRGYDYPLTPGKTWHAISTYNSPQLTGGANTIHEITGRMTVTGNVLGWERNIGRLDGVMVDGLKLKIEQTVETIGDSGATTVTYTTTATEWYVPAAGRSVVMRSTTHMPNTWNGDQTETSRLVNFIPTNSTDTE